MKRGRVWRRRKRKKQTTVCDPNIYSLFKWIKSNSGSHFKHCKLILLARHFKSTGRGLMTKQPIKPGDMILSIPLKCLVTAESVIDSDLGDIIKRFQPRLTPQRVLTAFLLYERYKGDSSTWHSYLQSIPDSFTTPAYFSKEELGLLPLQLQMAANAARHRVREVHRQMQNLLSSLMPPVEFQDTCWAWYAVNSRCVYLKSSPSPYLDLKEEESHGALAPYLDLLNHDPWAKTEARVNPATDCYELISWDRYCRYDQVFICYGPHGNHKLFLEYGFIVPKNPFSVFTFTLGDFEHLHQDCGFSHWEEKEQILRRYQLDKALHCSCEGLSWSAESVLRVLLLPPDHLQGWSLQKLEVDPAPQELFLLNGLRVQLLSSVLGGCLNRRKVPVVSEHEKIAMVLVEDDSDLLSSALRHLHEQQQLDLPAPISADGSVVMYGECMVPVNAGSVGMGDREVVKT